MSNPFVFTAPDNTKRKKTTEDSQSNSKYSENEKITKNSLENLEDEKPLDPEEIKKQIRKLAKNIENNRELRVKYADQHDKFFDSEYELYLVLSKLHILTCAPEFFDIYTSSGLFSSLIELITHENMDIAFKAIELIFDLIDPDSNSDTNLLNRITDFLIKNKFYEILIEYVKKIDFNDEINVKNMQFCIEILNSLIEYLPDLTGSSATESLLIFFIEILKTSETYQEILFDIVELITIIMRSSDKMVGVFAKENGIEIIVNLVSEYRNTNPITEDEVEFMESLFDCICEILLTSDNHPIFFKINGMELMILMIKSSWLSKFGALKVLSFLFSTNEDFEVINRFMEFNALEAIFEMMTKSKGSKRLHITAETVEEYCISCCFCLFKWFKEAQNPILEFIKERDLEDIDVILSLYVKYNNICAELEKKDNMRIEQIRKKEEFDQEVEDFFYQERLNSGLAILHNIIYIVFQLVEYGDSKINNKMTSGFKNHEIRKQRLINIMNEYIEYSSRTVPDRNFDQEKKLLINFKNF